MSKPTKATWFIHQAAQYVRDSQFVVTWDSAYEWVNMQGPGEDEVFLQGHEASAYIDEANALCKRYPSLDRHTAMHSLAKPYIDCLG